MYTKVEIITPAKAKEYLGRNSQNYRKIDMTKVRMFSEEMKAGRWQLNGESLRFSKSGVLLDGQHRLSAIIKANVPVETAVVYDVDDDVTIYDVGTARSQGQILAANGIDIRVRQNVIVGAANLIMTCKFTGITISKSKMLEYFIEHQNEWVDVDSIIRYGKNNAICRKSPIAAACFILLRRGADESDLRVFFKIANTGFPEDSRESTPAIALRNFLLENGHSTYEFRATQFTATIQAFYDFVDRRRRTKKYTLCDKYLKMLRDESSLMNSLVN